MKMKGIILNSEMVNTILDKGVLEYRKAIKLNNIIKHYCVKHHGHDGYIGVVCYKGVETKAQINPYFVLNGLLEQEFTKFSYSRCPFGKVGRKFFVKETLWNNDGDWEYSADNTLVKKGMQDYCSYGHLSPYRMKQDQSRLTVEITDIKVEKADVWEWVVNLKLIK